MYEIPIDLYKKINPLLQEPLKYDDIDKLKNKLAKLQSIRYELSYTRCKCYESLLRARERARIPKDKEYTEMDRKTILQASTSLIESDYEFMISLEKIVEDQIELGITFLQSM